MKKTVLGSILALAVSVALLAGATFAWFTDSIVNSGNKITAGKLEINAYAYDYDENGAGGYEIAGVNGGNALNFETEGQDLRTNGAAIIQETNWEPGASNAKLLKVENAGTLAAKVKLEFTTSGDLTDALWFDFIQVEEGKITGTFTKRPMNTLAALAEDIELTIKAYANVQFILVYGMYEDAGNDYQGKSFEVDVAIKATQAAVEEDGFGNSDYDAEAVYPVSNADEVKEAIVNAEDGDTIFFSNNMAVNDSIVFTLAETKAITFDLNGQTLKYDNPAGAGMLVCVQNGAKLTLENGKIDMKDPYYGLRVEENSTLILNDVVVTSGDGCVFSYGENTTVEINDCELTSEYYAVYHNGSCAPTNITIRNTEILRGGVYVSNQAAKEKQQLTIENSTIYGDTAVELKHTNAAISNSTLVGIATPTGSGENGNGGCTDGYALAITSNSAQEDASGTVVVTNCKFYSGEIGETTNGYYFVFSLEEGSSVEIDGKSVNNFNSYGE